MCTRWCLLQSSVSLWAFCVCFFFFCLFPKRQACSGLCFFIVCEAICTLTCALGTFALYTFFCWACDILGVFVGSERPVHPQFSITRMPSEFLFTECFIWLSLVHFFFEEYFHSSFYSWCYLFFFYAGEVQEGFVFLSVWVLSHQLCMRCASL